MRLIDSCITQLKAQGPSRTCDEKKKKKKQWHLFALREAEHLRAAFKNNYFAEM